MIKRFPKGTYFVHDDAVKKRHVTIAFLFLERRFFRDCKEVPLIDLLAIAFIAFARKYQFSARVLLLKD